VIKTEGGDNETDEFNCDSVDGVMGIFKWQNDLKYVSLCS
jgi:hypothetical protein